MSEAIDLWQMERAKENALSTAVSMAEYAIVMEAVMLCALFKDDPRMACLKQLVEERRDKIDAHIEQIPRTTAAMKAACAVPAMEASDVH